jgi:hypothetical protein
MLQCSWKKLTAVSFTYHDIAQIDVSTLKADLQQSRLSEDSDVAYADLIDAELLRLLGIHAPLMKTKRQGKNDCRWLLRELRTTNLRRR